MTEHPYIKYAQALLIAENQLQDVSMITASMVKAEVQKGLNAFSLKVAGDYKGKEKVKYIFCGEKNNAKESIFLAPNIITAEKRANDIYKAA